MPPGLGLGLGLHLGSGGVVGSPYSAEAAAYFAAVPNNTYSDTEKLAIDTFFAGLTANSNQLWNKIDQLFLLCAKSGVEAESRVNLRYPSYAANSTPSADPKRAMSKITAGGAQLVWTSGSGYVSTSGAEKLSGMYVPDNGYAFKTTGSHVLTMTRSNVAADTAATFIYMDHSGGLRHTLMLRATTTGNLAQRLGLVSEFGSGENATTAGIYISTMIEASKARVYKNGSVAAASDNYTPNSVAASPITLFSPYNLTTPFLFSGMIALYGCGGALTAAEAASYNGLLSTLFIALGV